jgi:glycosyltransferase involved in cell wall biosynthesis
MLKLVKPGTRVLFTFHTEPETAWQGLRMMAVIALLRFCDGVGFVSEALKRALDLPGSIPQAVVLGAPERQPARPVHVKHKPRRNDVLFVGPLAWPKKVAGVLLLLEAFAELSRTSLGWRVVVIGDGPLRSLIEDKVVDLGLQEAVELAGPRQDILSEIEAVELYAQISLQEGLPLSLLNAMAAGTPVIATRVGGMPEVIAHGKTGYLVEPTKTSVVDGLTALIQDGDLRRRLGAAARAWITTELTWEKVARRHLDLLSGGTV